MINIQLLAEKNESLTATAQNLADLYSVRVAITEAKDAFRDELRENELRPIRRELYALNVLAPGTEVVLGDHFDQISQEHATRFSSPESLSSDAKPFFESF